METFLYVIENICINLSNGCLAHGIKLTLKGPTSEHVTLGVPLRGFDLVIHVGGWDLKILIGLAILDEMFSILGDKQ
jgi:hypothetical protein